MKQVHDPLKYNITFHWISPGRVSPSPVSGASFASIQLPDRNSGPFRVLETSQPPVPRLRRVRVVPHLRRRVPELDQPGNAGDDRSEPWPLDPQEADRAGQLDDPQPGKVQHLEHGGQVAPGSS